MIRIARAESATDIEAVRTLFRAYAEWIGIDLGFQDFATELATLPGAYVAPRGTLLLACDDDLPLGCAAVRAFEWPFVAELKRLYVVPEGRNARLGSGLADAALSFARDAGYERIRLDTLPTMSSALALYERLGFREIEPYRFNPVEGTKYLELVLDPSATND
jgi:ribosomal protein S18 acetylase RimI-like enzyme